MAFWGVEVKPGTPYVHQYEDERGRLHVSQATIVAGSSNKRSVVQCNVGDKKPIYLCSLLPEKLETQTLNLEFEEEDEVTFSVIGPHPVHLSGFFYGDNEDQDNCCDDHDSDSYGEDVMMTESENEGDSIDSDSEDHSVDNEFSDDEFSLYPSQVPNSGVRIEEIVDEEKPASENDQSKQLNKKRSQLGTSNENENNRQRVVKSGTGVPVLVSEDEDGFPTFPQQNKSYTFKSGPKVEERDNVKISLKKLKRKEKDTFDREKLKRKIDAVSQDVEPTRNNNEPHDLSVQPDTATPVNETKQKKNKKKKVAEKEENARESGITNANSTGESPVAVNDLKQTADKKKEKKNKKQNKQQESAATPNTEKKLADKKVSSVEKKENPKAKSLQVRTFSNGLVIEELVMGKPDGKRASPGKKVSVRYIGKLKKNDKIFDSNIGKAPFKFRLGIGEVIKGWDVGVNGMRIGDKRRLTIPPAMGYGAKGCPPAIPQNSWLVFDVELVDAN